MPQENMAAIMVTEREASNLLFLLQKQYDDLEKSGDFPEKKEYKDLIEKVRYAFGETSVENMKQRMREKK